MARPTRTRALSVGVLQLSHAEGLPLPAYQTPHAAGLDLVAAVPAGRPVRLKRGASATIETGLVLELPVGTEAQVRPRSGLAARHGVTVLNSPGTIDADYRGEVKVILINLGPAAFTVARGERIAQLVVAPVAKARLEVVATVRRTRRGANGFGSTGQSATAKAERRRAKKKPMPATAGPPRRQRPKTAARRSGRAGIRKKGK
jgi:dUTP pyrophosphatase